MDNRNSRNDDHKSRSDFIRGLIQTPSKSTVLLPAYSKPIQLKIVQYWDSKNVPEDVQECMTTWGKLEKLGFSREIFDENDAKDYIRQNLGDFYLKAFDKCYHPAMQSDYFRLCYILMEGGCYIDADDVYTEGEIKALFEDGRLKIQPLCYDRSADRMVPPHLFTKPEEKSEDWIFYFNNNPLIARDNHPLIDKALSEATASLITGPVHGLPEIQSTTGPGNLSKCIFNVLAGDKKMNKSLQVVSNWEKIAVSNWELEYRNDMRNWRHSNRRKY